ncbi:MAG TPA: ChbG/HpnK family deacetylase [Caulobacteraceae bacterium]|nr:ChbG/HpnK family deacetylase [Caulobacteraceae bacterium]
MPQPVSKASIAGFRAPDLGYGLAVMTVQPYAAGPRTIVIHEDDLGMTHGANAAFRELVDKGICSCGSVMAPTPWFPEVAAMAAADPKLDVGVHLTLNAEKVPCRWRPLTRPPRSAGLTDDADYLHLEVEPVRRNAEPEAVEAELRAQIDAVLSAGIDVTHLDAHCGAIMAPEFVDIYVRLGRDYDVPIVLAPMMERYFRENFRGPPPTEVYPPIIEAARARGEPIFDRLLETPWKRRGDVASAYAAHFDKVPDGLTYMMFHFNQPGDYEAVEPELAHIRTEEYALFASGKIEPMLAERSLSLVGMRQIRDRRRRLRTLD